MKENKSNIRLLFIIFTIIAIIGLILYALYEISTTKNRDIAAKKGVLALAGKEEAIVPLSGEWEFYWQRFITEDELLKQVDQPIITSIPGVWNNIRLGGASLPGFGYATYRLKVTGLTPGRQMAIYVPVISVAYEMYVDHKLVAQNGTISKEGSGFKPSFLPQIAVFTVNSSSIDIIIHNANFIYARNGMWHPAYLGTPEQIQNMNRMIIYKDLFFIGALVIMALYHLSIYLLRKNIQNIYFVFLCIVAIMRMAVNGDRAIVRIIPMFHFDWIIRFDYIAILMFYPVLLLMLAIMFKDEFSKFIVKVIFIIGAVCTLITMALPVHIFTRFVIFAQAVMFLAMLYTLICIIKASLHSRKNASLLFFWILAAFFFAIHDALYQNIGHESPYGELSIFGFFLLILIESFILARVQSERFINAQRFSQQLIESDRLKDKIRQTEMAFLQSQIKPHFLYNALGVIDEYCEIDPKEASRLIGSLSKYLRQSFDFGNLDNSVEIQRELALVRYYVDIEKARFDDLSIEYDIDYDNDFFLPPLTIQPIVENAIRHGVRKKSGEGCVKISIKKSGSSIIVSVSDNGIGIPQNKLDTLLNDSKGGSVGLLNIHNRLIHMYGRGLEILSKEGMGTTVSFTVPEGGR